MRDVGYQHLSAALALLAACSATAPNEGLEATVTLDRERLVRGDALTITVAVAGGILQGSGTCLTGYNVLDAAGRIVAPGDVVCTADLVTRRVGDRPYVRQFTWSGHTGSGTNGAPLPAGIYRIVGGAGAPGQIEGSVSAPVGVELVDPDAPS
ncbi:MAG TPA: hypothetical protein VEB59_11980 [Gemmatimonadales bacterium]|nr:hypothetical protein [Gemmatimonadales bacterium]